MDLNQNLLHFLSSNQGWSNLNAIQKKTIPHIMDGEDTLILSPTASGKTEAALIPIFSDILDNKLEPVSVLYISPLKALINDMHYRIDKWCSHFNLTSFKWHGDVLKYEKDRFIKNPTDFLLITPESLEVIMMNRPEGQKRRIFENVRYILIDEIHYFAASDRGVQLNSLLNRISKYTANASVIGLSATVGNPDLIADWINLNKPTSIVKDTGGRKLQYKILNMEDNELYKVLDKYRDRKVLVFANSRRLVESSFYLVKNRLDLKNIYLHHGSINKHTRQSNEIEFKNVESGVMISTNTLELGIDIGDIDIIVQLSPPGNVSSFCQRIGRSGRQSKLQRTIIIARGFNLFVALAQIMLYHEDKIEKIHISRKSTDIFLHQILSNLYEKGAVNYKELYNCLTNCYAFSKITKKEYQYLLKHMANIGLININKNNLTLGYEFEKHFGHGNFRNFYAVFTPSISYKILEGIREIGTLDVSYAIDLEKNDQFNLAGKLWKITSIDHENYKIHVSRENLKKSKLPVWHSEGSPIGYLITGKINEILEGKFDEKFLKPLDEASREIIKKTISAAQKDEFRSGILPVELNNNAVYIYTFAGDKANKLLLKIFEIYYEIYNPYTTPVFTSFKVKQITESEIESIIYNIEEILLKEDTIDTLNDLTSSFKKNKFIKFLPDEMQAQLKMDLIFDPESLIQATKDKSINFIENSQFRKTLFKKDGLED